MRSQLFLIALGATLTTTACTRADPRGPTPAQQRELALELNGRVAGAPTRCLPTFRTGDRMQVIGSDILYHEGRTVWVNRTTGGCENAGRAGYILVTQPLGTSQHCSGDLAKVVTTSGGMIAGSCAFGDFIPYRAP